MKKFISVICFLITFSIAGIANAAPSHLVAVPITEGEGTSVEHKIELTWDRGNDTEEYDIWMSKNGHEWTRIANNFSGNEYFVEEIELYVNYYFIVADRDAVELGEDPLEHTSSVDYNGEGPNATDIVVAFPPGQTVHGNYKKNSNSCAACHRTHSAQGAALLKEKTISDTCKTCHDGTQSKYDVFRGEIKTDFSKDTTGTLGYLLSPSGPFGNILSIVTPHSKEKDAAGNPVFSDIPAAMSIHNVGEDTVAGNVYYLKDALKDKNLATGDAWNKPLGCGSCHSVHGSQFAIKDDSTYDPIYPQTNYRMLARILPGNSDVRVLAFAETKNADDTERIYYKTGMNAFCLGCHVDYYESEDVEIETENGTETVTYGYANMGLTRHKIDIAVDSINTDVYEQGGPIKNRLPLEGPETSDSNYNKNQIMCITCHNAHGSKTKYYPTEESEGLPNFLLKRDGDGVCISCHGTNFTRTSR